MDAPEPASIPKEDDGSGSFYDFTCLCERVGQEPAYNQKTETMRRFMEEKWRSKKGSGGGGGGGDLYLLCKLLLCRNDTTRKYNLRDRQLVKLLSRYWQCSHQDMVADLDGGDISGNAYIGPPPPPKKRKKERRKSKIGGKV